ncbi:MAG: hypothetical protein Q4G36_13120 [Paracoccus sp. (in: a-proteobacteria)]|nr:hypothetical protein [Paracoccus sp. (in: a-proteobacteria)]
MRKVVLMLRHVPPVVVALCCFAAGTGLAQQMQPDGARPFPRPIVAPEALPHRAGDLAAILQIELLSAAISAESEIFADRVAETYLQGGSGEDWRRMVAQIHDAGRISALWQARISGRIDRSAGHAQGRAMTDGLARIAAARRALADHGARADGLARYNDALGRGEERALSIAEAVATHDLVSPALASRMNRDLAVARGFGEAGGYGFPISAEDQAADIALTEYDLRDDLSHEIGAMLYLAFSGAGEGAFQGWLDGRPEGLLARAELAMDDLLIGLAREAGRAAAQRALGDGL